MAVAFGSMAAAAATLSCPYPAGIVVGDILLLFAGNTYPNTYTTPAGWTALQSDTSAGSVIGAAFWKVATGSESGTVIVADPGTVENVVAGIVRYPGATSTLRGSSSAPASGGVVATSPAPGAITGVTATDMVVTAYIGGDSNANNGGVHRVTTPPGGTWTTRLNLSVATTAVAQYPVTLTIVDKIGGTDTPTVSADTAIAWEVISVALVAGAGGGPAPAYRDQFLPFFTSS